MTKIESKKQELIATIRTAVRAAVDKELLEGRLLEEKARFMAKCRIAFDMLKGSYGLTDKAIEVHLVSGARIKRLVRETFPSQKHRLVYNMVADTNSRSYYLIVLCVGKLKASKPEAFVEDFQRIVGQDVVDFSVGDNLPTRAGKNSGIPCLLVFSRSK